MRARRQFLNAQKPPVHNGGAPDTRHITRWTRYTRGPDHSTCELRRGDVNVRNPRLAAGCCRSTDPRGRLGPPQLPLQASTSCSGSHMFCSRIPLLVLVLGCLNPNSGVRTVLERCQDAGRRIWTLLC